MKTTLPTNCPADACAYASRKAVKGKLWAMTTSTRPDATSSASDASTLALARMPSRAYFCFEYRLLTKPERISAGFGSDATYLPPGFKSCRLPGNLPFLCHHELSKAVFGRTEDLVTGSVRSDGTTGLLDDP